jgi:hypothetical protein
VSTHPYDNLFTEESLDIYIFLPLCKYEASDIKDLEDAPLVHSYGLILKQNEKTITLIADLIPSDNTFGRGTTIPKGMIKEIKDISIID